MKKIEVGLARLGRALVNLNVNSAVRLTRELNALQADPLEIMVTCEQALAEIGDRYASGEYYIAGLIMAGEIMKRVITLLTPRMCGGVIKCPLCKVLIGTVKGDIHDLGKNIAGALLGVYGFEVKDLGVDVPGDEFAKAVEDFRPRIVGLSALLSSCYGNLVDTIETIRQTRGASPTPYIFISGNHITQAHCEMFRADFHAATAFDTVRLCERLNRDDGD